MGHAAIDLTGQTFDQLTVVERVFIEGRRNALWRCRCSCGGEAVVGSRALRTGHTTSCGCKRAVTTRENQNCRILKLVASKTDEEMAISRKFTEYRGASKQLGRVFELTLEEFSVLVRADCHYCGTPPFSGFQPRSRRRGKVLLNGVDRVDCKLGYVRSNVVPCCKHCNKAKLDRTEEEFVEHCLKVVLRHERKGANATAKRA